jgi:hypothetical protein
MSRPEKPRWVRVMVMHSPAAATEATIVCISLVWGIRRFWSYALAIPTPCYVSVMGERAIGVQSSSFHSFKVIKTLQIASGSATA